MSVGFQKCSTGGGFKRLPGGGFKRCDCAGCDCPGDLPTSYTLTLSGDWVPVEDCWTGYDCTPSDAVIVTTEGEGECVYSVFSDYAGEICSGGKAVVSINMSLQTTPECAWIIQIELYDQDGGGGGMVVAYVQRTPNAADPTGIYDLSPEDSGPYCDGQPATVTVS